MILRGKQLGFTLAEIADLIGADDGAVRSEFEERLQPAQIVDQLSDLEADVPRFVEIRRTCAAV